MSERNPFHESAVIELDRLLGRVRPSAFEFETICTLIATTKISKGHGAIRERLETLKESVDINRSWFQDAMASVNDQEAEAAAKEAEKQEVREISEEGI